LFPRVCHHDTQQYAIGHNDTQHNAVQHNDTQHNIKKSTFSM
jgi:hypothetical protein